MIVFSNGQFIEEEKAFIGIKDLSIQRGYGIFDFFRTSNFKPLFLEDYLDRFYKSANSLRLQPLHSREELKDIVMKMIRINRIAESGFKMILTGGYSSDGYELSSPNFFIIQLPVKMPGEDQFEKGINIILNEYQRDLPETKSINYLMGIYLQQKIKQDKADDVLYYKDDCVLEFPRSNIFIVTKDETVVTPKENVLRGITRMKVLEVAQNEFKVEERAITINDLKSASEVFLTSTTKRIIPVLSIEGQPLNTAKPGKVTRKLLKAFLQMEDEILDN